MRLLHNTELYRVNSDYPSAQAFRYQNPTIRVLCLRGITEVTSVQANYIVMNIDESMFCIPIYSVQGRYNPDLWLDKANLNNGITTQISRNYNSNNYLYSRLRVNQLCCFRGIYTRSILFRIRKYQLRMRLLHNTELYRVNITNSDYPSAQTHRGAFASYQTANSSPII